MRNLLLALIVLPLFSFSQSMIGESIEHDPASNRFFTSSDNTSIRQRAANGDVSYFGSGLEASLGMEVMGNTLFAITGSRIKGYDLDTELEVFDIQISGAGFLNGLTNDGVSRLWATDFSNDRIYEIDASDFSNPSFSAVVTNTQDTPNGIIYDGDNNRLIFVTWSGGDIKTVDLGDYSVSTIESVSLSNMDGIDEDNQGNYYVSSWSPLRITRFSNDFSSSEIISAPGINTPADICYAKTIDTLAIPSTSIPAIFIGFGTTGIESLKEESIEMFPNPVETTARFKVLLNSIENYQLGVLSLDGKRIAELGNFNQEAAELDLSYLSSGTYFIELAAKDQKLLYPFIKK